MRAPVLLGTRYTTASADSVLDHWMATNVPVVVSKRPACHTPWPSPGCFAQRTPIMRAAQTAMLVPRVRRARLGVDVGRQISLVRRRDGRRRGVGLGRSLQVALGFERDLLGAHALDVELLLLAAAGRPDVEHEA